MSTKFIKESGMPDSTTGDRSDWILRLLYAPVNEQTCYPIIGTTRLMKGLFLIDRKLGEEFGRETSFDFEANKYGPLDPKVYDVVEQLEEEGTIHSSEDHEYNGTKYELTSLGEEEAKKLFDDLSSDEQDLISWIKGRHVLQSLSKLLSFVYNQYPEMAENSIYR